jgi:hypothetical protein
MSIMKHGRKKKKKKRAISRSNLAYLEITELN